MKKLAILFGIILVTSTVLAGISISEPQEIYNLGDKLYINLNGIRGTENGNLDIDLVCGNSSFNMVRIPARAFSNNEDQSYSVPYKILTLEDLGILNMQGIIGTCQIVASLGKDISSSKSFEITNTISIAASTDKTSYNPGEVVTVNIEAIKSNGEKVNGFIQGSNASSFDKAIEEGTAITSFAIPDTAEAGIYYLDIYSYDTSNSNILNEGRGSLSYIINQIATSLILSLSDTSVTPGKNFTIGTNIFDQSGVEMKGRVFVKIISPEGEETEHVISAGEFATIDFRTNSTVGAWKIVSTFDDLIQEREFEMMPLQKVELDFEDSVLVIKNVGNVLYNRTIDVLIGEETKTLELKIEAGDERKFNLNAPMGNYDVVVGDGEEEIHRQVLLTGNSISVSDFKNGGIFKNYLFIWIFFIAIFGGIGGVLSKRYRKTKVVGKKENLFRRTINKIKKNKNKKAASQEVKGNLDIKKSSVREHSYKDESMVDFTKKGMSGAESALVLKGEKHVSSVVALSLKDSMKSEAARNSLLEIVENSKGKGLVDYRGDYVFVIFSPLVTKTYKNEGLAVQCAMKIMENLNGYNKKFKDKINFGIGVHVGDLIASKNKDKLKYTGIGNTISFAKRMSDTDTGRVIVSDIVRKKLMREIKISKGKEIGENQTYVVDEVRNRSGDAERLKQLMKRSI